MTDPSPSTDTRPRRRSRSTRRHSVAVVAVALTLVAGACGSRADNSSSSGGNAGVEGPAKGGTSAAPADGKFGDIDIPCGPGDTSGNTASDTGVTADSIAISTLADPGGAKQGLNQGVFDSMQVFVDWCNDLGGINGRKLKLSLRDSALFQYKEKVVEACGDFAMVGSLGVLDNLGAQDQVNCGLPNIPAETVNPEQSGADLTFAPTPNPPWTYPVTSAQYIKDKYPDVIQHAAMLYTNLAVTQMQSSRQIEAYESQGYNFDYRAAANINESAWGPLVVGMKNAGSRYMTLSSSWEEVVPLLEAMDQQDFKPDVVELESNFYNENLPKQAPASADGTLVRVMTWPFEEADQNPAMTQYLGLLQKYNPDAIREFLGVKAFSAGLLFATAVKAMGADVTRAGLVDQIGKIGIWTGGGLHAPGLPAKNERGTCMMLMKIEGGKFVREYPKPDVDAAVYNNSVAKGYACPDPATAIVPITSADFRAMGAHKQ